MPRGGKRPGAGRPKGAISKSTRAIKEAAEAGGVTPLEVMLTNMRFFHAEAETMLVKAAGLKPGDEAVAAVKAIFSTRHAAQECAKDAAPYLHPRLTAVEHSGGMKLEHQAVDAPPKETREEWLARRNGELQGGVGGPAGPASGRPDGDLVH